MTLFHSVWSISQNKDGCGPKTSSSLTEGLVWTNFQVEFSFMSFQASSMVSGEGWEAVMGSERGGGNGGLCILPSYDYFQSNLFCKEFLVIQAFHKQYQRKLQNHIVTISWLLNYIHYMWIYEFWPQMEHYMFREGTPCGQASRGAHSRTFMASKTSPQKHL